MGGSAHHGAYFTQGGTISLSIAHYITSHHITSLTDPSYRQSIATSLVTSRTTRNSSQFPSQPLEPLAASGNLATFRSPFGTLLCTCWNLRDTTLGCRSHHITSHHITSHHITSHNITSHHTTSHRTTSPTHVPTTSTTSANATCARPRAPSASRGPPWYPPPPRGGSPAPRPTTRRRRRARRARQPPP